jgi:type IV pilus assembly protein PilA
MKETKAAGGFTMIELLVVVAIIGLLAAVAIPKFGQMMERSKEGATLANMSAIRTSVTAYYSDQDATAPFTLDTNTHIVTGRVFPPFVPEYLEILPAVKVTASNPVNGPFRGQGPLGNSVTYANVTDIPFATNADGLGWRFDHDTMGLWVNSGLLDLKDDPYSIYGYE